MQKSRPYKLLYIQERPGVLAATCAALKAPSAAHVCDPPEAFILHREIVLTMKPDFTLRAYLMSEDTGIAR